MGAVGYCNANKSLEVDPRRAPHFISPVIVREPLENTIPRGGYFASKISSSFPAYRSI
jgi:hypothetical protein